MNPCVKRAVLAVPDAAWQQITYPTAVPDPETGELISNAEAVGIPACTAFTGRRITLHLPLNWPWQHAWTQLFITAHGPPEAARRP
ncbi:hypothetical protein [Streptomyces sp. NPDC004721]